MWNHPCMTSLYWWIMNKNTSRFLYIIKKRGICLHWRLLVCSSYQPQERVANGHSICRCTAKQQDPVRTCILVSSVSIPVCGALRNPFSIPLWRSWGYFWITVMKICVLALLLCLISGLLELCSGISLHITYPKSNTVIKSVDIFTLYI